MQHMQELLQDYARTRRYRLETIAPENKDTHTKVTEHTIKNEHCADVLHMYVYKNNDSFSVFHDGNYCALVQASTEILCEILDGSSAKEMQALVQKYLQFSTQTHEEGCDINEVFAYAIKLPLSENRKECLLLPYTCCAIMCKDIF